MRRNGIGPGVNRVRLVVLGSSSSGNSTLIEADGASILVDAGFSCKEVSRRLSIAGADPRDLQGVVVTHEHTDHVRGVRVLARRHDIPVFGTSGTLRAADRYLQGVDVRPMSMGEPFEHDIFSTTLVPVPHDAAEPSAVRVDVDGRRLLVATDLGHFPWSLLEMAQDMDGLVFESNHDERMLLEGRYPAYLKTRIKGPRGHLSNVESAVALRALLGPRTRGVLLGHLSQQNNTEELALTTVNDEIPQTIRNKVDIRTTSPDRLEELVL
jgi:phosphoribosyl 1,2-cyclic phosphodiesterase